MIQPRTDSSPVAMDVKLQPTLSATARALDKNRQPIMNAQVSLLASINMRESANGVSVRSLPISYDSIRTDNAGRFTLPTLVAGGSYTVEVAARGYAAAQAHIRVETGTIPKIQDFILMPNMLELAGAVVDPAGDPLEGVEVWIKARDETLAAGFRSMRTNKDGRFQFHGLPKGEYSVGEPLARDGKEVTQTRQIIVHAGDAINLTLSSSHGSLVAR